MKILMINGSPKASGNTARALMEMTSVFEQYGVEIEYLHVGNKEIRGCVGCGTCYKAGKCFMDDIVNEAATKLAECDGVVIGSPVYYASANGTLIAFLDRLFYSTRFDKRFKVGAAVVCARRGGCTAAFDVLNKYFTISGMPVASSTYWNQVHGANGCDALLDEEGMQCMRNLGRNTAFLIRSIALGRETNGLPQVEKSKRTNFIR